MRGPLLNISDDMTYLYVAGDAANIGVVVVANVFVAPDVVAIVFFYAGGSKLASSKFFIYMIVENIYIS
jgi:hypothetical protein